jgi:serine/threonine protein kinase
VQGTTFGPYTIEELLGRGGMGEVYRAFDTETVREVALKVLPPALAGDAEYTERFRRECRAAARLREPHIVPIHRFGEIDGRLYLDMRLVEGSDLGSWLAAHGPLSPATAVAVVSQVASALDAAHAEGMVHRDVKPSNILLAGGRRRAAGRSG